MDMPEHSAILGAPEHHSRAGAWHSWFVGTKQVLGTDNTAASTMHAQHTAPRYTASQQPCATNDCPRYLSAVRHLTAPALRRTARNRASLSRTALHCTKPTVLRHAGKSGEVVVDEYCRTAVPSILAVGDVINRIQLTPVALMEGMAIAKTLFLDTPTKPDYWAVASAVFSNPFIASVVRLRAVLEGVGMMFDFRSWPKLRKLPKTETVVTVRHGNGCPAGLPCCRCWEALLTPFCFHRS